MLFRIAFTGFCALTMFAGCLDTAGSGTAPATRIVSDPPDELVTPTPTPDPVVLPTPTPQPTPAPLVVADFASVTLQRGSESIAFTSTTISDTLCGGGVATIQSASALNDVVTIVATHQGNPSWTLPVNEDCMIDVVEQTYALKVGASCNATSLDPKIWPLVITYTITRSGDDISVTRALKSQDLRLSCAIGSANRHETDSVASEVYHD